MFPPPRPLVWSLPTLLALSMAAPLAADELDHERVKRLRDRGEIVALSRIIEQVQRRLPDARVLEVELGDHNDGQLVYEIELLDADGQVLEHYYDARSGELVAYEIYRLDDSGRLVGLEYDARTGELLEREIEDEDEDGDEDGDGDDD